MKWSSGMECHVPREAWWPARAFILNNRSCCLQLDDSHRYSDISLSLSSHMLQIRTWDKAMALKHLENAQVYLCKFLWDVVVMMYMHSVDWQFTMAYWHKVSGFSLPRLTPDSKPTKRKWEYVLWDLCFFRSWQLVCLSEEGVGWLSMRRFWFLLLVCCIIRSSFSSTLSW